MNNNFAENLKKIRKDNNLSQEELAEELGVSRQAISKWESSLAYPEMDKIIALCDKFNLNIDDLLHKNIREVKEEAESKKNISNYIDNFLKFITDTINLLSNMSFKSKIKCIFEELIIGSILLLLSVAICFVLSNFFENIFYILPDSVFFVIENLLGSILILLLIIASIIIMVHIFKTRYLNYYYKIKNETEIETKNEENKEEKETEKHNKILFKRNESKIIIRDPSNSEYNFLKVLWSIFISIIKFFSLFILVGLVLALIFIVCLLPISFLIIKTGLFFIGLLLLIISSLIIDIVLILLVINFIFNRKSNKKIMIYSFIFSTIAFGIALGVTFIGTLNFKITEDSHLAKRSVEYEMKDNLSIDTFEDIKYVVENRDNVKIEYTTNRNLKLMSSMYAGRISFWTEMKDPINFIKDFISNTKENKIEDITGLKDITVYASRENIEKIKSNIITNEEIYSCENTIESLEEEIDALNEKIYELEQD